MRSYAATAERSLTVLRRPLSPLPNKNWMVATPTPPTVAVYGRYCFYLAMAVAGVVGRTYAKTVAISGNVGKDSGRLIRYGIPEAHYLLGVADGLTHGRILNGQLDVDIDLTAKNGLENAARMVEMLAARGVGRGKGDLLVVSHSTQMLRLGLTFMHAAEVGGLSFGAIYCYPSAYKPDPTRLLDQWEIFFEIVRIDELATEGLLTRPDIPEAIIAEAREGLEAVTAQLAAEGIDNPSTAGLKNSVE